MARMEQAIKDMVDMFLEYANGDGKLNKDELKNMIQKEIQNPELKAKLCAVDFDKAMERMDKNRDGEIDFKEFLKCMSCMAKCYYKKKTGKDNE
ncbi:protein S100-A6 [Oryzias melastigma]|uniref:Protein S100-A6-like n=1 Tax=Oryzias melastigma TaxID=30732 RepID=A0A3B3D943_ORYME|nr:protein S100-A6 [Oryzias melastigma]